MCRCTEYQPLTPAKPTPYLLNFRTPRRPLHLRIRDPAPNERFEVPVLRGARDARPARPSLIGQDDTRVWLWLRWGRARELGVDHAVLRAILDDDVGRHMTGP